MPTSAGKYKLSGRSSGDWGQSSTRVSGKTPVEKPREEVSRNRTKLIKTSSHHEITGGKDTKYCCYFEIAECRNLESSASLFR
jgi:hypothetical protein